MGSPSHPRSQKETSQNPSMGGVRVGVRVVGEIPAFDQVTHSPTPDHIWAGGARRLDQDPLAKNQS